MAETVEESFITETHRKTVRTSYKIEEVSIIQKKTIKCMREENLETPKRKIINHLAIFVKFRQYFMFDVFAEYILFEINFFFFGSAKY